MKPATWHHLAVCRDHDPEIWFPLSGHLTDQIDEAKRLCSSCPVETDCRQQAIGAGIDHGIWGGLTEEERRELKQHHETPHCVRCHGERVRDPERLYLRLCAGCLTAAGFV